MDRAKDEADTKKESDTSGVIYASSLASTSLMFRDLLLQVAPALVVACLSLFVLIATAVACLNNKRRQSRLETGLFVLQLDYAAAGHFHRRPGVVAVFVPPRHVPLPYVRRQLLLLQRELILI